MKLFGIHIGTTLEKTGNGSDTSSKQTTSATSVTTDLGGIELTLGFGAIGSLDQPCKPGRFYVYVHKNAQGRVFYVGKGTGNRAYSNDHGPEHQA